MQKRRGTFFPLLLWRCNFPFSTTLPRTCIQSQLALCIHQSEGGSPLTGYVIPGRVTTLASARLGNSSVVVAAAVAAAAVALGLEFVNRCYVKLLYG